MAATHRTQSSTQDTTTQNETTAAHGGERLVIVGGGFAGAALATHLLRACSQQLQITLLESSDQVGRGLAYGAEHDCLRLNVPAGRMSLDPTRPADFVEFAGAGTDPSDFLSRRRYGDYVQTRLREAMLCNPSRLAIVKGTAIAIDERSVVLEDGRHLAADKVVLAMGVAPARSVTGLPETHPRISDAGDERAIAQIHGTDAVLVVGTGLSALDALALLETQGHRGHVHLVSRHGLLPLPHAAASGSCPPSNLGPAPRSLRSLISWTRGLVREAERAGHPWQHALDRMRPMLAQLWQRLSPRERLQFVRHVRPYWEVLRHRAPHDSVERLARLVAARRLTRYAARIEHCTEVAGALAVQLRCRGGDQRTLHVQRVIRCVGSGARLDPARSPLIAAAVVRGAARIDEAGLGIVTDADNRVIDARGLPSERLFALGALCRASRWETTAVPEIAREAYLLAQRLTAATPIAHAS